MSLISVVVVVAGNSVFSKTPDRTRGFSEPEIFSALGES